jgi:hypothetical protein
MFPICTSKPTCFKRALEKGQLDHVDPAAIALIEGLQPNVRGDELSCKFDPLYVLDELTNMNKHRHLILTAMRGAMAQDIGNGAVAIVDDDAQRIAGIRGSDVKVDTQVVATISFANGPVEGKEVSNTLCWLADYVSFDVIPLFREFFK